MMTYKIFLILFFALVAGGCSSKTYISCDECARNEFKSATNLVKKEDFIKEYEWFSIDGYVLGKKNIYNSTCEVKLTRSKTVRINNYSSSTRNLHYETSTILESTIVGSKNIVFIEKDGIIQYSNCSKILRNISLSDCTGYSDDSMCEYNFAFGSAYQAKKINEDDIDQIISPYLVKNENLILSLGINKSTKYLSSSSQEIDLIEEVIFNIDRQISKNEEGSEIITFKDFLIFNNENPNPQVNSTPSYPTYCLVDTKFGKLQVPSYKYEQQPGKDPTRIVNVNNNMEIVIYNDGEKFSYCKNSEAGQYQKPKIYSQKEYADRKLFFEKQFIYQKKNVIEENSGKKINIASDNPSLLPKTIKYCNISSGPYPYDKINYFVFSDDEGKPYGTDVEVPLGFTNKLNLELEIILEKKGTPYLSNCYTRMRNGEVDIMMVHDEEESGELMELIPIYKCPLKWECPGNGYWNLGISKTSKFISKINEFRSSVLSKDEYKKIYNTKFTSSNQHNWSGTKVIEKDDSKDFYTKEELSELIKNNAIHEDFDDTSTITRMCGSYYNTLFLKDNGGIECFVSSQLLELPRQIRGNWSITSCQIYYRGNRIKVPALEMKINEFSKLKLILKNPLPYQITKYNGDTKKIMAKGVDCDDQILFRNTTREKPDRETLRHMAIQNIWGPNVCCLNFLDDGRVLDPNDEPVNIDPSAVEEEIAKLEEEYESPSLNLLAEETKPWEIKLIPKSRIEKEKEISKSKWSDKDRGYRDLKFGMSPLEVDQLNVCKFFMRMDDQRYVGTECFEVAGKKRNIMLIYDSVYRIEGKLKWIAIDLGDYDPSFWNVLKKSLKRKYNFEYELSLPQKMKNDGNAMVFFDKGRIALYQHNFSNLKGQLSQNTYIKYTKDQMKEYKRFKPNKVKKVESSEL